MANLVPSGTGALDKAHKITRPWLREITLIPAVLQFIIIKLKNKTPPKNCGMIVESDAPKKGWTTAKERNVIPSII